MYGVTLEAIATVTLLKATPLSTQQLQVDAVCHLWQIKGR